MERYKGRRQRGVLAAGAVESPLKGRSGWPGRPVEAVLDGMEKGGYNGGRSEVCLSAAGYRSVSGGLALHG